MLLYPSGILIRDGYITKDKISIVNTCSFALFAPTCLDEFSGLSLAQLDFMDRVYNSGFNIRRNIRK